MEKVENIKKVHKYIESLGFPIVGASLDEDGNISVRLSKSLSAEEEQTFAEALETLPFPLETNGIRSEVLEAILIRIEQIEEILKKRESL